MQTAGDGDATRQPFPSASVWRSLNTPPAELQLAVTLPTGQSFRWVKISDNEYAGVIRGRLVIMRQEPNDVLYFVYARVDCEHAAMDHDVISDYFNLDKRLADLVNNWAKRDTRFRDVSPYFQGARLLRQDPLECLIQFICSSNNNISRIHALVASLCAAYGTPLIPSPLSLPLPFSPHSTPLTPVAVTLHTRGASSPSPDSSSPTSSFPPPSPFTSPPPAVDSELANLCDAFPASPRSPCSPAAGATSPPPPPPSPPPSSSQQPPPTPSSASGSSPPPSPPHPPSLPPPQLPPGAFYAFPTLQQLSAATEQVLRDMGFGYRAKFIEGAVKALLQHPQGGEAWLLSLRQEPYEAAVEALCTLPGVGPKVAACVALFSLDHLGAVPVDTHVFQLAVRYYARDLAGKALTKAVHGRVQQAFVERFGEYAGWAHNTLFISELASMRHHLPDRLHPRGASSKAPSPTTSETPPGASKAGRTAAALTISTLGATPAGGAPSSDPPPTPARLGPKKRRASRTVLEGGPQGLKGVGRGEGEGPRRGARMKRASRKQGGGSEEGE